MTAPATAFVGRRRAEAAELYVLTHAGVERLRSPLIRVRGRQASKAAHGGTGCGSAGERLGDAR